MTRQDAADAHTARHDSGIVQVLQIAAEARISHADAIARLKRAYACAQDPIAMGRVANALRERAAQFESAVRS